MARRTLGDIEQSISDLEAARSAYGELGNEELESESAISLAASVAMAGDISRALQLLDDVVESQPGPRVRAHAVVQRAGLVARAGDFAEALDLYRAAQPVLEEVSDTRWLALMHSSRGLVHAYSGDFDQAEDDLSEALGLYQSMDRASSSAEMIYNLGFVAIERGDVARGLALYLDAEGKFDELKMPAHDLKADRAHAYMLAGLPGPACVLARDAADALERSGDVLQQAEATYLAAQAALADRDLDTARSLASRAVGLADEQSRPVWSLLAQIIREEARWRSGEPTRIADLEKMAVALEHRGLAGAAAQARLIAAMAAISNGDLNLAEQEISAVDQVKLDLPVELMRYLARGRLSLASNDLAGARRSFEAAADFVDGSRSTWGATEARVGVSRLAEELADTGLASYAEEPSSAIAWLERFRGASLRAVPVVSNPDREVADLLARLRSLHKSIGEMGTVGEDTTLLFNEAAKVEAAIRDKTLANSRESGPVSPSLSMTEVVAALGKRRLLYLYRLGESLRGSVLGGEGQLDIEIADHDTLSRLGDHLASDLRRSFLYPGRAVPARVGATMDELSDAIFGPLPMAAEWVIVPSPDLIALPWNALAKKVIPDAEVVVSPSAWMWKEALARDRTDGPSIVVGGPGLTHSRSESVAVSSLLDEPSVLIGADATVEAAIHGMDGASLAHVVTHTRLRHDNPMFSSLELVDGMLNLYDMERLNTPPGVVVLSACDSAQGSVVSGYEMYGLASVLLGAGTRSIVATVAPIPDSERSIDAVVRIHRALAAGASVPEALAGAIDLTTGDGVDPSVAFVAYGA